jgi:4-diphosphocytidyl-2-C-methyl-D-erythritol kinase
VLRATRLAPAKINLFLRVLGRLADGCHEVDSLLLPLTLADEVQVSLQPGGPVAVTCCCPEHPALARPDNLAARAARAYLEALGHEARVEVELRKRTWVAAGLGGGSSDAASVLLLLDELVGPLPDPGALARLASGLGADVPFFLGRTAALARGRGDRLKPLPGLPSLPLVLLNPGTALPTASVYAGLGLRPGQRTGRQPVEAWRLSRLPQGLEDLVENDLGPVAEKLCPAVRDLRRLLLEAGARRACLTGSGPTVFGLFADPESARGAAHKLVNIPGFSVLLAATASA